MELQPDISHAEAQKRKQAAYDSAKAAALSPTGDDSGKPSTTLAELDDAMAITAKPDRYYLKAMNCPHHHKLYDALPRSYRDLPLRLAEYGTCHRYEQSGELFGLMRVRSLQMNDAHIYCTPDQFESEFRAVNEMYLKYFKLFGIEKYVMRFSTHDPARLGQKFVDEPELWQQTEEMVRGVLQRSGINYVEVPNEAAFYGPKIDVQVWSAIGREFTIAYQPGRLRPAETLRPHLQNPRQHRRDAALHSPRAARHARAFHRLPHRALRRQLPLWLSPSRSASSRSATKSRWSNTPARSNKNSAPAAFAPSSTRATTTSKRRSPPPSR
jgi:threonyl-tRNA synthetase